MKNRNLSFTAPGDDNESTSPKLKDSLFLEQGRKWSGGTWWLLIPYEIDCTNQTELDETFKKDQDEDCVLFPERRSVQSKTFDPKDKVCAQINY